MALINFLNVLTLVSLAILHTSLDPLPVNALSVERGHLGRDLSHVHAEIAKKRGDSSKKCRPRPSGAKPVAPTTSYPNSAPSSNPSKPSSTSSSSQPAQTNVVASSIDSKIMYGYSNNEQHSIPNFLTGATRLIYNWKLDKYDPQDFDLSSFKNLEFVPTAHSREDVIAAGNLKRGYARYIKNLNEPEIIKQANVSPEDAHKLWMDHFEHLTGDGYKLIAPAVTGAGITWMKRFLQLCDGKCTIYALDYHHYGLEVEGFKTAVNELHQLLPSVPVWITEIGCHDFVKNQQCTQGIFDAYFPGVMSYVESTPWIQQVAWFGMFTTQEIATIPLEGVNAMIICSGKDCKPNDLGKQFINYH